MLREPAAGQVTAAALSRDMERGALFGEVFNFGGCSHSVGVGQRNNGRCTVGNARPSRPSKGSGPNNPTSSTLNFPFADDRANAVTVALGAGGSLSATYAAPILGPTAHVILDVTGYFVPAI
jgi:hypothetical protein